MFGTLGRFVSRHPWYVIAGWVVLAVAVVATAPALQTTSDESEFLPDHYESIQAAELQADKFADTTSPAAILVFEREDGAELTDEDQADVAQIAKQLGPELGDETFQQQVVTVTPKGQPNVSEDGLVQIGIVGLAEGASRLWMDDDAEGDPDALAARVAELAWAGLRGVRTH